MIFATCGSSHFGFDRMMEALAALPAEELEVQHGPAQPPPGAIGIPFLPFDDVMAKIQAADIVVSHAGVGSILCTIRAGHTPVIFPRLKRFRETVDDHQEELAEALARQGSAIVARSGDRPSASAPHGTAAPHRDEHRHARAGQRGTGKRHVGESAGAHSLPDAVCSTRLRSQAQADLAGPRSTESRIARRVRFRAVAPGDDDGR